MVLVQRVKIHNAGAAITVSSAAGYYLGARSEDNGKDTNEKEGILNSVW